MQHTHTHTHTHTHVRIPWVLQLRTERFGFYSPNLIWSLHSRHHVSIHEAGGLLLLLQKAQPTHTWFTLIDTYHFRHKFAALCVCVCVCVCVYVCVSVFSFSNYSFLNTRSFILSFIPPQKSIQNNMYLVDNKVILKGLTGTHRDEEHLQTKAYVQFKYNPTTLRESVQGLLRRSRFFIVTLRPW